MRHAETSRAYQTASLFAEWSAELQMVYSDLESCSFAEWSAELQKGPVPPHVHNTVNTLQVVASANIVDHLPKTHL